MLYNKQKKTSKKKRSYEYLHTHASSEQVNRRKKKGRVMLSGKPKAVN